ncbi:MAG TPA: NADH-quinone oxidoreductase subunit N, partial [Micromonospora sp.]
MTELKLPDINYVAIAPILIMLGAACLGVLVEAFVPRRARHLVQLGVGVLSLLAALWMVVRNAQDELQVITAGDAIALDGPALFLQGSIIVLAVVALLLIGERSVEAGGAFVAQAAIMIDSE